MTHPWFNEQVERRVREYEIEQEKRRRAEAQRIQPIIAISGDHGALREHVARRVAGTLGFGYWDREILHQLSREGHIPESLLEPLDEHRVNRWAEAFAGFRLRSSPRSADYVRVLRSFVQELAQTGRAVIVGRGVRFLLHPVDGFRVHVSAPFDSRVKAVMSAHHLDEIEAKKRIETVDAERAAYIAELFGGDVHGLDDLDLVVNTGTLSIQLAASTIVDAYRRRFDIGST